MQKQDLNGIQDISQMQYGAKTQGYPVKMAVKLRRLAVLAIVSAALAVILAASYRAIKEREAKEKAKEAAEVFFKVMQYDFEDIVLEDHYPDALIEEMLIDAEEVKDAMEEEDGFSFHGEVISVCKLEDADMETYYRNLVRDMPNDGKDKLNVSKGFLVIYKENTGLSGQSLIKLMLVLEIDGRFGAYGEFSDIMNWDSISWENYM